MKTAQQSKEFTVCLVAWPSISMRAIIPRESLADAGLVLKYSILHGIYLLRCNPKWHRATSLAIILRVVPLCQL